MQKMSNIPFTTTTPSPPLWKEFSVGPHCAPTTATKTSFSQGLEFGISSTMSAEQWLLESVSFSGSEESKFHICLPLGGIYWAQTLILGASLIRKTAESSSELIYLHCLICLSLDLASSCLNFSRKVLAATATAIKPPVVGQLNIPPSSTDCIVWNSTDQPRDTDT